MSNAECATQVLDREVETLQRKSGQRYSDLDDAMLTDMGFMFDNCLEKVTCEFNYGKIVKQGKEVPRVSVILSYVQDDPGFVQSGHYVWPAAPAMCEYMEAHFESLPRGNVVELGAGCGLAGLVFAQLDPSSTVIFTDHDPGALKTIQHNVTMQMNRDQATCYTQSLRWGPEGANEIERIEILQQSGSQQTNLIIGSDVIYAREIVGLLFWTIDRLMTADGKFLMCSSFSYDDETEAEIDAMCVNYALVRNHIVCTLPQGTRIQMFHRQELSQ
jgi:predicted nicotinamide N-methyase